MADSEISNQFVFALTAGAGWAMIAYEGYARQRGLPAGSWLRGEGTVVGFIALITGVVLAAMSAEWWYGAVALAGAWLTVLGHNPALN